MRKGTIINILIFTAAILLPLSFVYSQNDLSEKLKGKILLQTESSGEAWYVRPGDQKRYYLGRPADALRIMKEFGQGVTDQDLAKIPIGIINNDRYDTDGEGLSDSLEKAIGTDIHKQDSDGDGYNDLEEVTQGYDPNGSGLMPLDQNFTRKQTGKILLQVEKNGEAWYVDPENEKRYFLGRPYDALQIMSSLGLGIKTKNLYQIDKGTLNIEEVEKDNNTSTTSSTTCSACQVSSSTPSQVLENAANAINKGEIEEAREYFIPEMRNNVEYSLNFLDEDGRFTLANIMRGTEKTSSTGSTTVFSDKIFFDWVDQEVEVKFEMEKRSEGWLLKSL